MIEAGQKDSVEVPTAGLRVGMALMSHLCRGNGAASELERRATSPKGCPLLARRALMALTPVQTHEAFIAY